MMVLRDVRVSLVCFVSPRLSLPWPRVNPIPFINMLGLITLNPALLVLFFAALSIEIKAKPLSALVEPGRLQDWSLRGATRGPAARYSRSLQQVFINY